MWAAPLHDKDWVSQIIAQLEQSNGQYNQKEKIIGLLSVVKNELDVPLFYPLDRMCNTLHLTVPPMKLFRHLMQLPRVIFIRSALLHAGYKVSNSHTNPNAVKTDAPNSVVWDLMRSWHKLHPSKNIQPNSPAHTILNKEPRFAKVVLFNMV